MLYTHYSNALDSSCQILYCLKTANGTSKYKKQESSITASTHEEMFPNEVMMVNECFNLRKEAEMDSGDSWWPEYQSVKNRCEGIS